MTQTPRTVQAIITHRYWLTNKAHQALGQTPPPPSPRELVALAHAWCTPPPTPPITLGEWLERWGNR